MGATGAHPGYADDGRRRGARVAASRAAVAVARSFCLIRLLAFAFSGEESRLNESKCNDC